MLLSKIFAPPGITYTVSTPTGVGDLCQKNTYQLLMLLRNIFAPPGITYTVSTPTGVGDLCQKIHISYCFVSWLLNFNFNSFNVHCILYIYKRIYNQSCVNYITSTYLYYFKFNIVYAVIRFTLQHRGCDCYFTFNLWYLINYNTIYNVYNPFFINILFKNTSVKSSCLMWSETTVVANRWLLIDISIG